MLVFFLAAPPIGLRGRPGYRRMMLGLRERDLLRDLFGHYVGEGVAGRAVMQQARPSDDVQEVAILFIDLTGFTHFAATRRLDEVADVLNAFIRIVVGAEYTVIGDAVNEASRLADHAKSSKGRMLCSQAAFDTRQTYGAGDMCVEPA
jgi:class 3 adenylate cyclase